MAKKNKSIEASALKTLKSFEAKQSQEDSKANARKKDNRLSILLTSGAFVVALVLQFVYFNFGPGISPTACIKFTQTPLPSVSGEPNPASIPDAAISECRDWNGTMKVNNAELGIKLFGNKAPQAVANFVDLASVGFFTDNNCHRLVTSGIFVLQCGDPNGNGTGGPGYSFGPLENTPSAASGVAPTYKKGWLAMARTSNSATSMGSQFFIVYKDSQIPNDAAGGYTVFGEITSGLDGLNNVFKGGVVGGASDGKPKVAASIKSITVK